MRKPQFNISKLSYDEVEEFKKRLQEYNEYRGQEIINWDDCNKPILTKEQKIELYNYNVSLGDLLDDYLKDNNKGLIENIKDFVLSLDKEKCKRINIDKFLRGYQAIVDNINITTKEYDEILNANLDKELRREPYDCKKMPYTCNYKYFLKSFFGILNKETREKLYGYLYEKICIIANHTAVAEVMEKVQAIDLSDIYHLIDNKVCIEHLGLDRVESIYKALNNKTTLKILKDRYGREIINQLKNQCYQHIYYEINRDIMHLKKSFHTLARQSKYKHNVKPKVQRYNLKSKLNKKRNLILNKDFLTLAVCYNNEKHNNGRHFTPMQDKYKDKERDRLRRRLYYLANKEKIMEINRRYIAKKKGEQTHA